MADLTLALDLGPTSVGWALLDSSEPGLRACGVRVFPEGVERDKGKEVSKNEKRRIARAQRRPIRRRSARKRRLRRLLVDAGLLPACALLPRDHSDRVAWERDQFKLADPYTLRADALRRALQPHEIGRVLLHLGQRRGFQSNRRADKARRKETSEVLAEIDELEKTLAGRSLGEYLAGLRDADPQKHHLIRLRGRHTRRSMYEQEFDAIWTAQQPHHAELLNDEVRARVRDAILFQRPLHRPGAGLIGRCELISRLPRCPRADRRAQRFRLYQEVSNLRAIFADTRSERLLTPEERAKLIVYLSNSKERSFDDIRKHLFANPDSVKFNLERADRTKLKGLTTDHVLAGAKALGRKNWSRLDEDLKDRIVAAIIDDNLDRLRYLLQQAQLDPAHAEGLLELDLEEGYVSYSLHAIKKLLPHLAAGLPLTSRDASTPCALRAAGYLMPWERSVGQTAFLPEPPAITNPLVRAALVEVRKVVNTILRELVYKPGHRLAHIHLELAREVQGTALQRAQRSHDMHDRERERAAAAEEVERRGIRANRDAINRLLLWNEQRRECAYCPHSISPAQLFGGEIHVDHIWPRQRSLDDSLMNKVVCCAACNADKADRTPHEWLAGADPTRFDLVLQKARACLPIPKYRRMLAESVELDDFVARQLVDTSYITSKAREYLLQVCPDIVCVKGQHTATLRRHWGLDTVLEELQDSPAWREALDLPPGEKNRLDHRHHAIDAIVIALTDHSRLQQLADVFRRDRTGAPRRILPPPWPTFRADVAKAIGAVVVSHRVRRRVRGQLHEDTVYGPTKTPGEFAVRKELIALTPAMIPDIRDEVIRRLVCARLQSFGLDHATVKRIPPDVWRQPLWLNESAGVAIKKVRIVRRDATIQPIRGGAAWVKPGSLHHVCFFRWPGAKREGRDAVFVSVLEATARLRKRTPVVSRVHPDHPSATFMMSLSGGEALLISHEGQQQICHLQTAASTSKQIWFKHHAAAGDSSQQIGVISKKPGTLEARKVLVDPIGRVRRAND